MKQDQKEINLKGFSQLAGSVLAAQAAPASARIVIKEHISFKVILLVAHRWFAYNHYRNKIILAASALILGGYSMTIFAISNSLKL